MWQFATPHAYRQSFQGANRSSLRACTGVASVMEALEDVQRALGSLVFEAGVERSLAADDDDLPVARLRTRLLAEPLRPAPATQALNCFDGKPVVAHVIHYCGGDECDSDSDEPNTMCS